jgi:hypothetical protein
LISSTRAAGPQEKDATVQRRHFRIVADGIATIANLKARQAAAYALAKHFADVNPHFDRDKFIRACGA